MDISEENLDQLSVLLTDPAQVKALAGIQDPAEAQAYLNAHGISLSLDEVTALGKSIVDAFPHKDEELADDELTGVTGGVNPKKAEVIRFFAGALYNLGCWVGSWGW